MRCLISTRGRGLRELGLDLVHLLAQGFTVVRAYGLNYSTHGLQDGVDLVGIILNDALLGLPLTEVPSEGLIVLLQLHDTLLGLPVPGLPINLNLRLARLPTLTLRGVRHG